jgi:hypothetical protein
MSIPHSLVMMALGLFRFGVNRAAYQSLRSELEFRRASVGRVSPRFKMSAPAPKGSSFRA